MLFRLWDHRLSGQCFLVQILQHRVRLAKQKIHIEHTIIIIGMRTRDLNYARMTQLTVCLLSLQAYATRTTRKQHTPPTNQRNIYRPQCQILSS